MSLVLSASVAAAGLGLIFALFVLIALQKQTRQIAVPTSRDPRSLAVVIQIDEARRRRRA